MFFSLIASKMSYFLPPLTVQGVIKLISLGVPRTRDWVLDFFAKTVCECNPRFYKIKFRLRANENNSLLKLLAAYWITMHSRARYREKSASWKTSLCWISVQINWRVTFQVRPVTCKTSQQCTTPEAVINFCFCNHHLFFKFTTLLFSYALETFTRIGWVALSLLSSASWQTSRSYGWAITALQGLFLEVMIPSCKCICFSLSESSKPNSTCFQHAWSGSWKGPEARLFFCEHNKVI